MTESAGTRFDRLVDVMRALRGPQGCPWDREQTLASLKPFVLEETYELLDALDREDVPALREELGDFLFEAVFLAQICYESGQFTIGYSIQAIIDKLVRRHPHVFTPDGRPLGEAAATGAAAAPALTAGQVIEKWEDLKARERSDAGTPEKTILTGVPRTLPSLLRAYELGTRAATVGFDWPKAADVIEKIEEEVAELKAAAHASPADPSHVEEELGDLLFALANLARKIGIEPEAALRKANDKFQRRFTAVESRVREQGKQMRELDLDQL